MTTKPPLLKPRVLKMLFLALLAYVALSLLAVSFLAWKGGWFHKVTEADLPGRYSNGSTDPKYILVINPDGTFLETIREKSGEMSRNSGKWRFKPGKLPRLLLKDAIGWGRVWSGGEELSQGEDYEAYVGYYWNTYLKRGEIDRDFVVRDGGQLWGW